MNAITYSLQPISAAAAHELRELGGAIYVADEKPGFPCRQCLLDAEIGDELILVSHDPFTTDTPYRSASPIFLHREPCRPPVSLQELPEQLTCRTLSVRAFNAEAMMIDAAIIDGKALEQTLTELFEDMASSSIHIHNADRGCWATSVKRYTP